MFWLEDVLKHTITHLTEKWYQLISSPFNGCPRVVELPQGSIFGPFKLYQVAVEDTIVTTTKHVIHEIIEQLIIAFRWGQEKRGRIY